MLNQKPYEEFKSLFLCKQENYLRVFKNREESVGHESSKKENIYYEIIILELLADKRVSEFGTSFHLRVIAWLLYYGHTRILRHIINHVKSHGDSSDLVFGSNQEEQTRLLNLCCYSGNVDMVELVLQYIRTASVNRTPTYFDTCILDGIYVFDNLHRDQLPLTTACEFGHLNVIKSLLKHKADPNLLDNNGQWPLFLATEQGRFDIIKHLVQNGADVNFRDYYSVPALYIAAILGLYDIVKYLVENGADVNMCGYCNMTPLFQASAGGHCDIVTFLLQNGANVNLCDVHEESPLHAATTEGHSNVAVVLVQNGADVNLCADFDISPLFQASAKGRFDIVKYLVQNDANVNRCDDQGRSPLFVASENGHVCIVKYLVENGANINLCDVRMKSPLYRASEKGHCEIVKLLLRIVDHTITNECGTSPLEIALWKKNYYVVQELVRNENKRGRLQGNHHFFEILADIIQAKVGTDNRKNSMDTKQIRRNCLPEKLWLFIKTEGCTDLSHLLNIGLDANVGDNKGRLLLYRMITEEVGEGEAPYSKWV